MNAREDERFLVEHMYVFFLSLYILEKIVLDFVLKRIDIICSL